tara:strand:- start:55 stop:303 length:249 start_codon:yes stop_codon:yes gene_type:complete
MYPIGSESWSMTKEKDMIAYVNKYNYMVIFPDRKVELFKSLRDIQNSISIDSSTISKKLKNDEHIFTAKGSEYIFYIQVIGK